MVTHLQAHFCQISLGTQIHIEVSKPKMIFFEKSLSVHMFVRPVDPSNPVCHHKKVTETQNFAKTKLSDLLHGWQNNIQSHTVALGEAKPSYVYWTLKPNFKSINTSQSRSKAVVCASTPRKYPQSKYFLVESINVVQVIKQYLSVQETTSWKRMLMKVFLLIWYSDKKIIISKKIKLISP